MEEIFSPCRSSGMRPVEERESETSDGGYEERQSEIGLGEEATFGKESQQ